MGLVEAVSIGVGTMIGASIFTVFGVGVKIAGPNLPIAFMISSFLAFVVAYSYSKLSARIVSNAGPIEYMIKGLGDNIGTGAMSILILLSYIVSISLFLKGFAGYFLPFVGIKTNFFSMALTESVVISVFIVLNFFGSKVVGRSELFIVGGKVLVLGLLITAGIWFVDPGRVQPVVSGNYSTGVFFAASVFFLSYMGFGLITNASENIKDPKKNVPRAIFLSIAIVTVIYILVSVVVIGNLPLNEIISAKENALAEAARPSLGGFGFIILSIGALFSISSALNATLYGGANISYTLAKEGELPEFFERKVWFRSTEGLFIVGSLGLLLAIFLNIESIASVTSAIFMSIYIFVLLSHYRLVDRVGGKKWIIIFGLVVISATFVVLMYNQFTQNPMVFFSIILMFLLSLLLEGIYRKLTKRGFPLLARGLEELKEKIER
ncbi:MAG: amino acid permease [Candidatus Thermoplasmatota archaeon]|nr:amino acid permease [Candidatus Thermoplasmatota archaeon]